MTGGAFNLATHLPYRHALMGLICDSRQSRRSLLIAITLFYARANTAISIYNARWRLFALSRLRIGDGVDIDEPTWR